MLTSELKSENNSYYIYRQGAFFTCGFLHQKKNGLLSFIESEKYLSLLNNPYIKVIICREELLEKVLSYRDDTGIIVAPNPRELLFKISATIKPGTYKTKIHETARISERALISPFNVFIGENVYIDDGAIVKQNTIIRNNVKIGAGTILGPEGLMVYSAAGIKTLAEHNGFVYIDNDAILLCNVIIERAVFSGDITYIGRNTIMDSGVSVSHGCRIGEKVVVGANAKICGYTKIGHDTYIGPGATISNNLDIGENSIVRIGSTLVDNLSDNSDVSSSFAISHQANLFNKMRMLKNK